MHACIISRTMQHTHHTVFFFPKWTCEFGHAEADKAQMRRGNTAGDITRQLADKGCTVTAIRG